MSAAMLSSKVASAAAFGAVRPTRAQRASSVVAMAKTTKGATTKGAPKDSDALTAGQEYALTLPGISAPFDNMFDPLNLTRTAKPDDVKRYRESEIVHGRVAMLAALGFVIGEQLEDFPAFMNFDGQVTGPAIYQFQKIEEVRPLFWEALVLVIGLAETYRVSLGWATPTGNGFNNLKDDYEPGQLYFDPLGIAPKDDEEFFVMQTRELNNGRLAMVGIAGFVVQELVNGREIFEHLLISLEREVIMEVDALVPGANFPVPVVPGL